MDTSSSPSNFISVFSTLPYRYENSCSANGVDRRPLNLWPGLYQSPITISLWETRSKFFERLLDPSVDAPPQSQLVIKTPSQSRTTVLYNFSSDLILREQYRDSWNEVRIGKLLEDLDALASIISVKWSEEEISVEKCKYIFQYSKYLRFQTFGHSPPNMTSIDPSVPSPSNNYDPTNGIGKPLKLWPGMDDSPVIIKLWEVRSKMFERFKYSPKDGTPQAQLPRKTPSQSGTVIHYNFSTDFILREQYRNPWNEIRIGKLLEDLDALVGTIAVKHCSDDDTMTRSVLLVTASVDKIVLRTPLSVDFDLRIVGSVTWVGRSSIEIQLEVTQSIEGRFPEDSVALTANFIFVARDSQTSKAAPVNRLSPETEKEKKLFEDAEARNKLWKRKRGEDGRAFECQEVGRLKELLTEGRIFCDMPALADRNSILLRDTRLENSLICQPQQRNIHGRIFGGFLMHRAFELAFSTAYAFAGMVPCFLEVDHVDFLRPVDVGDFLRFKSCVLYTEIEDPGHPLINVEVVAHVTSPELRSAEVSNIFYFTFTVRPEAKSTKNGFTIRNVVPATEEEARTILERKDAKALQSIKDANK